MGPSRPENNNPFTNSAPARGPQYPTPLPKHPPPIYTPPAPDHDHPRTMKTTAGSNYAFLTQSDTIFLIDDSGSMAGRSWRQAKEALGAITPICTAHDADGIDIYFLNHRIPLNLPIGSYDKITTTAAVDEIFHAVEPFGGTPTAMRLNDILKPYLETYAYFTAQGATIEPPKPHNIIVITDGIPSDDPESVIVHAAKRLDTLNAQPWQVGIQFFQIGNDPKAAKDLRKLDDDLKVREDIRDMVDTVPWNGKNGPVRNTPTHPWTDRVGKTAYEDISPSASRVALEHQLDTGWEEDRRPHALTGPSGQEDTEAP